jgi:3-hydroxyisobutyrate dehydrogenase-like beta-hydroxyacid dehydrogenase
LVSSGAKELCSLKDIARQSDIIILCLPNSETVRRVLKKIVSDLQNGTLLIDCTTNSVEAVNQFQTHAVSGRFRYAEAPLTGGQVQAETATLGAIVGCARKDFEEIKTVLGPCCQTIERFGDIGSGAKAKLISNFLALGTATLVVEAMKAARDCEVDWEKFYKLACRGSGHSMSLDRIAPKAIDGEYDSYVFSIANTLKDLSYIRDIFEAEQDYGKIAQLFFDIYQKSNSEGNGEQFLSSRLKPRDL